MTSTAPDPLPFRGGFKPTVANETLLARHSSRQVRVPGRRRLVEFLLQFSNLNHVWSTAEFSNVISHLLGWESL